MPRPRMPPPSEVDDVSAFLAGAGIVPDARILDAPCGIGRRARGLAERGYRVVAVDANVVAIEASRRRVPRNLADRFQFRVAERGALPGLTGSETFDAILCLDHALGRGPPQEDAALLARLRRHATPKGLLLVDFLNRDFFAARRRPFAYHVVRGVEQHEFRSFDPVSGILELTWKFYQREGADLRFRGSSSARLRLLAPHEAEGLLRDAGWIPEAWYGGWAKEAVTADRRKLLLTARPAARG